ncbi:MAG: glycoside hydrolase family 2 TIM barrel-domain containing protein [Luteolibacter sp.]
MIRKILLSTCLLLVPVFAQAQRTTELFNFAWKFKAGKQNGAQSADYNDSDWRALDLPHDFQIEQPWDKSAGGARGFKAMGEGWYRKTFKADPAWKDKRVLIDFEGMMLHGEAWLNGKSIGTADFGYLGFESDVSEFLNYDGDNILVVQTSTGETEQSRWYTGGGLFRDVHLVVKNRMSFAKDGIFISTPKVSDQSAEVRVQAELEGFTGKSLNAEISAKIYSPDGKLVAESKTPAPQGSKLKTVEVPLPAAAIENPQRWSCETPNLYTAKVALIIDEKPVDEITETFGIRTIEFSKDFGFKLNGKKIFLKGISNHHDLGAVGAAAYERAIERQLLKLKQFGFNHVRTSHNPYSKSFLRVADKHGILVVDELFDKWGSEQYWPGRVPFDQLWYKALPQWIKRDRNHPSVILWSLGNELQHDESLIGFPTGDWGVTGYKILDVLAKRYDPTRKTTVGIYPARAGSITKKDPEFRTKLLPPELSLVTDIASFNYEFPVYRKYLESAPDLIIYQSEAATYEMAKPFFGMDREKMVGLAFWGAIEYWGESNRWPKKGWNYSFFNHALEPYPQAYLIQSAFSEEPLVCVGVIDGKTESIEWNDVNVGRMSISSHWNRPEGSHQNVTVFTNAEEVELFQNGQSLGIKKNELKDNNRRNIIYWSNVAYGKGGELTAVARNQGKEVARHTLQTAGKAVALKVEVEHEDWKADGMDLQYVKVRAVDDQGREVPTAEGTVTFDVSGAARLIAVDNGDHYTDELFSGNRISLSNGFAMAILRSTRTPGEVTLRASTEALKSEETKLRTK